VLEGLSVVPVLYTLAAHACVWCAIRPIVSGYCSRFWSLCSGCCNGFLTLCLSLEARAVCALVCADEAGVASNSVLWIIQALSSAIKRNDPPPTHTHTPVCRTVTCSPDLGIMLAFLSARRSVYVNY